jgi:hypothetical protein
LGVDQSVLLLKKGNDLEKSAVFSELGKFNDASRHNTKYYGDYRIHYEDFALSGAAIITNGKEEIRKQKFSFIFHFIEHTHTFIPFRVLRI